MSTRTAELKKAQRLARIRRRARAQGGGREPGQDATSDPLAELEALAGDDGPLVGGGR